MAEPRHLVVGTAGHIDHGKSALVQALTGVDPDRLKEEKARGITIDLGFAHFALDDGTDVALVDVPGHERFVKNMLAGASGIDAVLLVVAADESVMPQTREHFDICRLLDVRRGAIVITKADLVDEDTVALVGLEARDLVSGSFLQDAPVIAVSSRTGAGLDALRGVLSRIAAETPSLRAGGAARLPIDRVFSVRGFGTVVTGTLVRGRLAVDDELEIVPGGRRVKVRGLQVHGHATASAIAATRVAVNLASLDVPEIERGQALAAPGSLESTRRFDARLDLLATARPLRHGARVRVHSGTSEAIGRVSLAGVIAEGGVAAAPALQPGERGYARLRLEAPVAVARGDRFIVRAYSPMETIGGGTIVDPAPERGGLRTADGCARLRAWDSRSHDAALASWLADRGMSGVHRDEIVRRLGAEPGEADALAGRVTATGVAERAGAWLVSSSAVRAAERTLVEAVAAHHAADPASAGLPREDARTRLFARMPEAVFQDVVGALQAQGVLVGRERLALPAHRASVAGADETLLDDVVAVFERAGLAPPDLSSVVAEVKSESKGVEQAVAFLVRQRRLVRIEGLVFHPAALEHLKASVRGMKTPGVEATLDVATVKQRFGLSRKYAIPLLEFLDRERVTRRTGDRRLVL